MISFSLIFLQSSHAVGIEKVFKTSSDFFPYFNYSDSHCEGFVISYNGSVAGHYESDFNRVGGSLVTGTLISHMPHPPPHVDEKQL